MTLVWLHHEMLHLLSKLRTKVAGTKMKKAAERSAAFRLSVRCGAGSVALATLEHECHLQDHAVQRDLAFGHFHALILDPRAGDSADGV